MKLKKTTIPDLEKLLKKAVEKAKYAKLEFEKPDIGQYVNIPFSVQDTNSARTDRKSSQELEEIIKETLKDTNWRLMDRVSYRLGYLQGRLKGYEQEEDMIKLVTKTQKPPKPQEKVDPKQYAKYAHHNIVQLSRMMGKHDAIRNIRKRRLEKEPEGFFLEPSEGPYQCSICRRYKQGDRIWWTLDEVYCDDCRRNAEAGVIPKNLKHEYDDEGQWISEWQIKDRHGVHPATRGKYVREGFLKARQLKDFDGSIYCTVFLTSENKEFLKKHPKIEKQGPKITVSYNNETLHN